MEIKLSDEELAQLLRKPVGEKGKAVAELLSQHNRAKTVFTYGLMTIQADEEILEIGFGNGKLLSIMFEMQPEIKVSGIDISGDMVNEAIIFQHKRLQSGRLSLIQASVSNMPFRQHQFHKVCSINTIYFWETPEADARAIHRVLRPGGRLYIAVTPKDELVNLKVTRYGFRLYEDQELKDLLMHAGFSTVKLHKQIDPPIVFEGKKSQFHSLVFEAEK